MACFPVVSLIKQVDMARLALVRKRREDAEKQKAEEGEGQGEAAKERMEKAKANASSGPQKLNPLEVRAAPHDTWHTKLLVIRPQIRAHINEYLV